MSEQPHIHFIDAPSFQEAEKRVNAWIDEQPAFKVTVLSVNVLPMMLEGKLIYLTIVMYAGEVVYAENQGGRK